jgi:hypothetical protein
MRLALRQFMTAPRLTPRYRVEGGIRALVSSAISVVQLAAGGCAELKLGTEHEECGWSGDFRRFAPHLDAMRKVCGYTYDHCWDLTSAMAKEILAAERLPLKKVIAVGFSDFAICTSWT